MTASAHTTAMQARIEHDDFIDSSSPYEGEIVTDEAWPLPPVKPWAPKASVWSRIFGWLGGLAS